MGFPVIAMKQCVLPVKLSLPWCVSSLVFEEYEQVVKLNVAAVYFILLPVLLE